MQPVTWGVLGTGYIASRFVESVRFVKTSRLHAVGSRSRAKAESFATEHDIPRVYGSYEDLVTDREIDVVYVATPHTLHCDNCILSLNAGKHVLCEKPFTTNAEEARQVIELARRRDLFCMEAMWTRFIPLYQSIKREIEQGVIGEVRALQADFGIKTEFDKHDRRFNPELAGGALLDLGSYLVSLAFDIIGAPENIDAQACLGTTGVDEQVTILLQSKEGRLASLMASLRTTTPTEAVICGTRGHIRIHTPLYRPYAFSLTRLPAADIPPSRGNSRIGAIKQHPFVQGMYFRCGYRLKNLLFDFGRRVIPFWGTGYNYEIEEVSRCLSNGQRESSIMPLDESLKIMETLDVIRERIGVQYPQKRG